MKVSYFKTLIILIGVTATAITSCNKSSTSPDDSVSARDANNVSNAMASTSDDAASAAGQVSSYKVLGMGANWTTTSLFVDATITDTSSTGIVISYAGINPCNGIIRSGTITVTNTGGLPWHMAGAVITVNYDNLKIAEVLSGYTYTLNGTHTITNETGGLAWQVIAGLAPTVLTPATTVTHRIQSSNMNITFPNGISQRNWTVDRTRSWSSNGSTITVSLSASPQSGGNTTETGTNRFGDQFTNSITSPIMANNSSCELWRPYTGTWTHAVASRSATIKFGTNSTGQQIGTASYCPPIGTSYGFFINYTNGNTMLTRFVSYW